MGRLALAAGASLARTAAALAPQFARSVISNAFQPDVYGPRLAELAIQTSTEGAPVPIVFGRMRLAGQVIWAARFTETAQTRSAGGGKGGPKITEYSYALSFAVGLCEGPIAGVGRVWANGEPLDTGAITMRVHTGGEDQAPDPLIEAVEGAGSAPGYRGLAYVVFEDLPLDPYGQRIPNLSFEVFAASSGGDQPRMEDLVEGVCLIPASGEFAYASEEVVREIEPGFDRTENRHTLRAPSDFEAALDDLQARLPHCRSVALVTAWFGTDLRAGECEIRPGVETRDKETRPLSWSAAGLDRSTAHLVSQVDGSPAYGGTPADATVISAIRALKARGFAVTLYPFILMDVPAGNGLPDPYGGAEQAVYPWRGRITCHPAPGQAGSPDKTAAAAAQMAAFAGTVDAGDFQIGPDSVSYSGPNEWRLSRFILHHCALAAAAGGVESVIIGSEMRGASTVRDGAASYPFVTELKRLAGEARALLGPQTKISYAADWSEYSGHAPADGSGDRIFHLDPFWSDPDVDFIGIDWYGPLADWREGGGHADALAGARSIHDRAYLGGNVEGGEGYDWFYASEADRDAQVRTPITDGAYGEPWIWRYKDLRAFWESGHHDRIGGVRQPAPTAWTPRSKPVRLVELGCPAIDKGANQPNVFIDPKSSESFAPYFSTGARDDLIQRRYVETLLDYWAPANGRNPDSPAYAGPMLDLAHSHVWTWDARPFPEFPAREDVWTDGPNWRLGHWLTGRAGQSSLADIVTGLANRAGLDALDTSGLDGVLAGYVVDRPMPARAAIEQLGRVFGFDIADRASGPACVPVPTASAATPISAARLPRPTGWPLIARRGRSAWSRRG
ncbi:MAG: glycoside hydrolase TIM-barrel-like domain-containing protein [Oceanicaulis sp.]